MEFPVKFLLLALLLSSFAFATWDNASFSYRRYFSVNGTGAANQYNFTNYTIFLTLNSSNFDYVKAQSNLSDVAVYCDGVNRPVFNMSVNTSGNSYILFNPPYTQGANCYVYYGGASLSPTWTSAVFGLYFTEFNQTGTITQYGWNNYSAISWNFTGNSTLNYSVNSGIPQLLGRDSYNFSSSNYTLLARIRSNYQGSGGDFCGIAFNALQRGGSILHYRFDVAKGSTTMRLQNVTFGGGESSLATGTFNPTAGQYYTYKIGALNDPTFGANITAELIGENANQLSASNTNGLLGGWLGLQVYGSLEPSTDCEAEWLGVIPRNYTVDPVPNNFGVEESNVGVNASQHFQASDFESNASSFNLTVTVGADVTIVQPVALEWNGTNYTSSFSNFSSGLSFSYLKSLNISLLDNNASVVGVRWFYNVTFTNASTYQFVTGNSSQTLLFAYNVSNFSLTPSVLLVGASFTANTSLYNASIHAGSITDIEVSFNGSNTSMTQYGNSNYSINLTAPSAVGSYTLFSWFNFTFNGITKTRYSRNQILTVSPIVLYSCNGTYPLLLNFTFAGEENRQLLNASMNATFTVWSSSARMANSNYTFSWINVSDASVCVSTSGMYNVDSFQTYVCVVSGCEVRDYFLYNYTASTASPPLTNLIVANASFAKLLKITSTDSTNIPLKDYLISAYRYYPELNQYILVGMAQTDQLGLSNTYLTPNDVWYRFVLYSRNTGNVSIFTPQQIQCDPLASFCSLTLQVTSNYGNFFNWFGGLGYSCSVDTTANSTSCTIQDNSGSFSSFTLALYQVGLIQTNTLCSNTLVGSSGTVVCTFNDSGLHSWVLRGSNGALIASGSFNNSVQSAVYGASGLLLTFLLFIAIAFIASYSLSASLMAGAFSLMLAAVLGLFIADLTLLATVLILAVLVGLRLKS